MKAENRETPARRTLGTPQGGVIPPLLANPDSLTAVDVRKGRLVKLRYFAGLSFRAAAEVRGISMVTAKRDWAFSRAWRHQAISSG